WDLHPLEKRRLTTAHTHSGHSLIYGFSDGGADLGVTHLDMPLTPETVWRAIRDPKSCDPTGLMGDLD
ncbi:MAG: hypothetical protein ACE1Y7_04735, partial [Lysobacteraceae bacterium]